MGVRLTAGGFSAESRRDHRVTCGVHLVHGRCGEFAQITGITDTYPLQFAALLLRQKKQAWHQVPWFFRFEVDLLHIVLGLPLPRGKVVAKDDFETSKKNDINELSVS